MSRIVDDEPPIKTHPASKEYRENWDRIFGEKCGAKCNGRYVDFQGADRPCFEYEGCGLHGCAYRLNDDYSP